MHGLNVMQGMVIVRDNTITEQQENDGINIMNATAILEGNTIMGNADHGIELASDDTAPGSETMAIINNNRITGNLQRGIDIRGVRSSATMVNNTIARNSVEGLLVFGATATLSGDTITDNTGNGLRLRDASSQGARVRVGCDDNVVTLARNTGVPIMVDRLSQLELGSHIFSNNGGGDEVIGPFIPCRP
jgi:hypothetical protein